MVSGARAKQKIDSSPVENFGASAWFRLLGLALLLVFTLVIYLPSFKPPFHYDDMRNLLNNPYLRITSRKLFLPQLSRISSRTVRCPT